jgi:glycosyltransferase Alg8
MTSNLSFNFGKEWRLPSEVTLSNDPVPLRRGATWRHQLPVAFALAIAAAALAVLAGHVFTWISHRIEILLVLGGIGCWRWGWFVLQSARAMVYRYLVYPRLRHEAANMVAEHGPVPEVTILAVTYREKPWITQAVFESVFRELASIEGLSRAPRVVVVTGSDQDDEAVRKVYDEFSVQEKWSGSPEDRLSLVSLRGDTGKRAAIADGLREISAANPHRDGVVILMDGDTMMGPGMLQKVLPLFRLKPEVSAVTTNEDGWVKGPRWFAEWISLRFGLRHRLMCSVSLSGRLLCLTGRFSVFRASVATDPTFLRQIERDSIHHWLWDSFDMLSGDDKSTWHWLAARGCRMLYVPDAMVRTLEVIQGSAVQRALANIRRWSGNSLRHSWRALKLGPSKLGWFCWYSLLDQRLAIWTVLVGPMFALMALCNGHLQIVAGYVLWVMCSRVAHSSISWWHGRRFSAYYLPLQIVSDWVIALTKIWILFHPAKQAWLNRGGRTLDTTKNGAFYYLRTLIAHYLYGFTCVMTIILIGIYSGFLSVLNERPLFAGAGNGMIGIVSIPAATSAGVVMFGAEPQANGRMAARTAPAPMAHPASAVFTARMFSGLPLTPLKPVPANE